MATKVATGGIANAHMRGLLEQAGRAQVVAVVDINEQKVREFAAKYDIPHAYTDAAEMLREQGPRLVHIATPPGTHAPLSIAALRAGAWVLCEKPLCGSLAQIDALHAAEDETGNYCSSVFQWRFGSGAAHLKQLIGSGALGRPLVGHCQTTWFRDYAYYQVPWRGKYETELGGCTMGHGIHAMDLFCWLMGDWREIRAQIDTLFHDIEVEDVSMALVQFESGARATVLNSVLSPHQETHLRFDFEKATAEVRHHYSYLNANWLYTPVENRTTEAERAAWTQLPPEVPSTHGAQTAALLDSLERNERPLVSGVEARRVIEFVTGLYKSARTGQAVVRGSIARDDPFYHSLYGGEAAR